jgi:catalase
MIALAEEADEEYGRRLREGLANASKGGSSQKPLGNKDGDHAPEKAVKKGHEADPY